MVIGGESLIYADPPASSVTAKGRLARTGVPIEAGEPGETLTFLFLALDSAGVKIEEVVEDTVERDLFDAAIRCYESLRVTAPESESAARNGRRT
jgi:hypothetical protein